MFWLSEVPGSAGGWVVVVTIGLRLAAIGRMRNVSLFSWTESRQHTTQIGHSENALAREFLGVSDVR